MPRRPSTVCIVEDFPPERIGKPYPVIVRDVAVTRKKHCTVVLEHLSADRRGVQWDYCFTLPLRPAGLVAQLLRAAGIAVAVNAEIDLADLTGRKIVAIFDHLDGEKRIVRTWQPCTEGDNTNGTTHE